MVPEIRIRAVNDAPVRPDREWVVYWMTAIRRTRWSFALQRAADRARELGRPLLVLEALRCGYPYASDRIHRFVLEGMADNAKRLARRPVAHHAYVEPDHDAGKGLLAALGARACLVVTDDFPTFMLPRMTAAAGRRLDVRLEAVDGNGIVPIRAPGKAFSRAYDFRRHLQRSLREHLADVPVEDPLRRSLPPAPPIPDEILSRWPAADLGELLGSSAALRSLPIDHDVTAAGTPGGEVAGRRRLREFLDRKLSRYAEDRNQPGEDRDASSGLSPYLHFGHVSSHEILFALADREDWTIDAVAPKATGSRSGWWGVSAEAEAFLDQLITWREVGFNGCLHRTASDPYETLPAWARRTLEEHEGDRRDPVYETETFEEAKTHDDLWNAAQRQLLGEGKIHNVLRMVWGKKILEWSPTPRDALATMFRLNDRYALDGRDPNSESGILWCLGKYDRAWGPERPIFGKVRYMSTRNTARKVDVKPYLARHGR
jgi:deoxyribodipyrimidine photo-lyase